MQNDCNETNVRMWFGVLWNETLMVYREGSADVTRPWLVRVFILQGKSLRQGSAGKH